ncbi:MAG: calcium/sodium antiporter [Acidobacteriota bacterium]
MIILYFFGLLIGFVILFKCAGWFVEGAVGFARILSIPKLIVGIVFVGLATTAPEFGVSVQAAYMGHPEIALGNAIGSVICDDGIAIALAAILAPTAILINCRLLKIAAVFLLSIDILAYLLARNGTIGRLEGMLFIFLLVVYYFFLIRKKDTAKDIIPVEPIDNGEYKEVSLSRKKQLKKSILLFAGGIVGVFLISRIVILTSIKIALYFSISETIIGLTVIAMGTSLPEISTCITAARKGEGEIAVGNIIGADILNVLWIIGASALVNPITVDKEVINFTFPFMIFIVAVMLISMRIGCRIGKPKGIILFSLYLIYLYLTLRFHF